MLVTASIWNSSPLREPQVAANSAGLRPKRWAAPLVIRGRACKGLAAERMKVGMAGWPRPLVRLSVRGAHRDGPPVDAFGKPATAEFHQGRGVFAGSRAAASGMFVAVIVVMMSVM